MTTSKFALFGEGATVDYNKALVPYYNNDIKQLQNYGTQLAAVGQQEVEAAKQPLLAFKALGDFSKQIGQAVKANKQAKQKDDESIKSQVDIALASVPTKEREYATELLKQFNDIKDLKLKYAKWSGAIEASDVISDHLKNIVLTQHGGNLAYVHERLGFQRLNNLPATIQDLQKKEGAYYWGGEEYSSFQAAHDHAVANDDESSFLKDVAFKQLKEIGFNDEYIASTFYKPVNKWLNTKDVMSKLRSGVTYNSQREIEESENLKNAITLDEQVPGSATTEFQRQLVSLDGDKSKLINRVTRLINGDLIDEQHIKAIKEGDLPIPFAAGSKGSDLLDADQWAEIDNAILKHKVAINNEHQRKLQIKKTELLASVYDGSFVTQFGGNQEMYEHRVELLKAQGLPTEDYNDLMDIKVIDQTQDKYSKTIASYTSKINAGELDDPNIQDRIDKETNINAKRELQNKSTAYQTVLHDNKIPSHTDRRTSIGNRVTTIHKETSLREAGPLFGISAGMADEIAGLENQIMWNLYQENPKTTTLKLDTELALTKILDQRGFFAEPGSSKAGIYTPEINGEHKNYREAVLARSLKIPNWDVVEANKTSTLTEVVNWDQSFNSHKIHSRNSRVDGETLQDTMINTLGLLEPDDIVSPVQFLALDDKGTIIGTEQKFKATPKLHYLSGKFNKKTKLQIWKAQASALINSEDQKHQDLVKVTKLKDKLKAVETASKIEESVQEFLKRSGDESLLYHFYAGAGTWSPNVSQKMMNAYHSVIQSDFLVDERGGIKKLSSFRTDADEQKELNEQLTNK